uniref:Uncharacterized protein n=1 Tax=viral metagenome TaxID=1070528 RepID=A0A6C0DQE3_9ZZZZ
MLTMHTFYYTTNIILKNKIVNTVVDYKFIRPANQITHLTNVLTTTPPETENDTEYKVTQFINNKTYPASSLFLTMLSSYGKYSIRFKFNYLNNILNNCFIDSEMKEQFLQLFSKIQSTYHTLNVFMFRYKMKRAATQVNKDVFLNPIDLASPRVISIYQNNNNYLFTTNDLINIINNSLGNNSDLFADPLIIKNPYNNLPFTKSILYTIYFFMKKQPFIVPELFHAFFLCNFNISIFLVKNEIMLRDYAIKEFLSKSTTNVICREIKYMISNSPHKRTLIIHPQFPKDVLVKELKPILRLYYSSHYSLNRSTRSIAMLKWRIQLEKFVKNNPQFGRRKVERILSFDCSSNNADGENKIYFMTNVHREPENLFHDFMNDHLVQYTEDADIVNFRNLILQAEEEDFEISDDSS